MVITAESTTIMYCYYLPLCSSFAIVNLPSLAARTNLLYITDMSPFHYFSSMSKSNYFSHIEFFFAFKKSLGNEGTCCNSIWTAHDDNGKLLFGRRRSCETFRDYIECKNIEECSHYCDYNCCCYSSLTTSFIIVLRIQQ